MKALIFYARDNEWTDAKTGEHRRYLTVNYLEDMPAIKDAKEKGISSLSVVAEEEAMKAILTRELPAVFDIEIGRRPGPKGKPSSVITKAEFKKVWKLDSALS
jgi:hypothetical protein